jgi:hypothetical protein
MCKNTRGRKTGCHAVVKKCKMLSREMLNPLGYLVLYCAYDIYR